LSFFGKGKNFRYGATLYIFICKSFSNKHSICLYRTSCTHRRWILLMVVGSTRTSKCDAELQATRPSKPDLRP
jgi:hypothetical protein